MVFLNQWQRKRCRRDFNRAGLRPRSLAGKVRLELLNKMGTDAFKVHVDTANNVVYLSFSEGLGKTEREKAAQLARATEGVKKVIAND